MTGTEPPVTEDDLHAFVDDQLGADRRPAVLRHLRDHPEDAARIAAYGAQRAALRVALAARTADTLPARLDPRLILVRRETARRTAWRAAAVVALAFGIGGAGGWVLRGQMTPAPNGIRVLVREAVANHVVYTADRRRPTELGADQRDDLARWVSNRLNHPVAPPDLSALGYRFMGGRLAATPEGPAGMFMYQNDRDIRLTVFVRPDSKAHSAPMVRIDAGPMDGCAWIEHGVGYTVVAKVPPDELSRLAEQVRLLVDGRA
jgi:anti-sigma factor RsiW